MPDHLLQQGLALVLVHVAGHRVVQVGLGTGPLGDGRDVLLLQRLELQQLGAYSIDVTDNGEEVASIPLRVMMAGSGKN